MYQDGISDVFIDQCRSRITRKEENDKFNKEENLKKLAKKNSQLKQFGGAAVSGNKKDGENIIENLTYDDQGKPLSQVQVKTEGLPNLVGYQLSVKDTTEELQAQYIKEKKKN